MSIGPRETRENNRHVFLLVGGGGLQGGPQIDFQIGDRRAQAVVESCTHEFKLVLASTGFWKMKLTGSRPRI